MVAVVPSQTADEVRFNVNGSDTIVGLDSVTGSNLGGTDPVLVVTFNSGRA